MLTFFPWKKDSTDLCIMKGRFIRVEWKGGNMLWFNNSEKHPTSTLSISYWREYFWTSNVIFWKIEWIMKRHTVISHIFVDAYMSPRGCLCWAPYKLYRSRGSLDRREGPLYIGLKSITCPTSSQSSGSHSGLPNAFLHEQKEHLLAQEETPFPTSLNNPYFILHSNSLILVLQRCHN